MGGSRVHKTQPIWLLARTTAPLALDGTENGHVERYDPVLWSVFDAKRPDGDEVPTPCSPTSPRQKVDWLPGKSRRGRIPGKGNLRVP